jgi:NAD(P)-dependent dehydrogenase (short-subunit alcohol dehydrogenase family)
MAEDGELAGRVCVVTGGTRGLGRAIVERFLAAGARVVVCDRDEEALGAMQAELGVSRVHFYRVDVSNEDQVVGFAQQVVDDCGRVDVLVNNAGLALIGPSMTFPLSDWQESLNVMATGVFLCCREFAKPMRAQGGAAIINISSMNSTVAFPMRLAYNAAKAAVNAMTQVLAIEWAAYGIRVNAICPGVCETRMLSDAVDAGLIDLSAYVERVPMRRLGRPEEIASVALFLASDASSFVTGQMIYPDGGWSAFGWIPWSGDPEAPERAPLGSDLTACDRAFA